VKLSKLTGELEEEKQLNCCLRDNQTTWQGRVTELEDGLAKKDIVSRSFLSLTRVCSLFWEFLFSCSTVSTTFYIYFMGFFA